MKSTISALRLCRRRPGNQPLLTGQVTGVGAVNMLEAMRIACPQARFYQASSSEMYGLIQEPTRTRKRRFIPAPPTRWPNFTRHWMTVNYRESFGMHAIGHPVQSRKPVARDRVRDP